MADKYRRSVLLFYLVIKFRERKPGDSTTVVRTSSSTPVQVLPGSSVFTGRYKQEPNLFFTRVPGTVQVHLNIFCACIIKN